MLISNANTKTLSVESSKPKFMLYVIPAQRVPESPPRERNTSQTQKI